MADVIETHDGNMQLTTHEQIPSNSKTNAALTLGIIGTALAGMSALGVGRSLINGNNWNNGWGNNCGYGGYAGGFMPVMVPPVVSYGTIANAQLERAEIAHDVAADTRMTFDELENQKRFYEGYIDTMKNIHKDFDEAKQRDIDNSFALYKYTRDSNDCLNAHILEASHMASAQNAALGAKVAELENKIDVMAAVRPYQDALINEKINRNALIADSNLFKRTCRMIQGELILPSTTTVSGYESWTPWNGNN